MSGVLQFILVFVGMILTILGIYYIVAKPDEDQKTGKYTKWWAKDKKSQNIAGAIFILIGVLLGGVGFKDNIKKLFVVVPKSQFGFRFY